MQERRVDDQRVKELRFIRSGDEVIPSDEATKLYLKEKGLSADPVELAYILSSDANVAIYIDDRKMELEQVLTDNDFWRFIVFLDLKKRGYRAHVLRGSSMDLVAWEKKKDSMRDRPRYIIKIVNEGKGETVRSIIDLIKYSESNGMQLILALVSADGTLTYYKAFTFKPMKSDV